MPHMFSMFVKAVGEGKALGSYFFEDGDDPEYQQLTGISQDQYEEFAIFMESQKDTVKPGLEQILFAVADTEDPEEIAGYVEDMNAIYDAIFTARQEKLAEIVTPEQLAKMRQLELQQSSLLAQIGVPIFNFDSYLGLGLSKEQEGRLENISSEMLKEQLDLMDDFIKNASVNPEDRKDPKRLQELAKKQGEIAEKGKQLISRIKARIIGILTKDQLERLEKLQADLPEFIKNKGKKFGVKAPQEIANDDWKKSWKPGDPIPEHVREREKAKRRLFPMPR